MQWSNMQRKQCIVSGWRLYRMKGPINLKETSKLLLTKLHHNEKTIQILVPLKRSIRENLLSKISLPNFMGIISSLFIDDTSWHAHMTIETNHLINLTRCIIEWKKKWTLRNRIDIVITHVDIVYFESIGFTPLKHV